VDWSRRTASITVSIRLQSAFSTEGTTLSDVTDLTRIHGPAT
jgi:hypothetical protein